MDCQARCRGGSKGDLLCPGLGWRGKLLFPFISPPGCHSSARDRGIPPGMTGRRSRIPAAAPSVPAVSAAAARCPRSSKRHPRSSNGILGAPTASLELQQHPRSSKQHPRSSTRHPQSSKQRPRSSGEQILQLSVPMELWRAVPAAQCPQGAVTVTGSDPWPV